MSGDQFFTSAADVGRCWDFFHEQVDVPADAIYIEPAAGGGAFYNVMPADRRIGLDIDPQPGVAGVRQADFLSLSPMESPLPAGAYYIGNPPFGRRGSLAREFVSKSFELGAALVGFILPRSGQRGRALGRLAVGDRFELPGGGSKGIGGCEFVLYDRRGWEDRRKAVSGCSSWISLGTINHHKARTARDEEKILAGDYFIPCASRHGQRTRCRATREPGPMNANVIRILRDREGIEKLLLATDWMAEGKQSSNRNILISHGTIRRVVMDAGFVDGGSSCDSWVRMHHLQYGPGIAAANERGRGKESRCEVFVRKDAFRAEGVAVAERKESGIVIGIELLREKERLREFLLGLDWSGVARRTMSGRLQVSIPMAKAAVVAGGFVDEADEVIRGATSGCDFYVRGDLGRPQVRDGVYASVDPLPAKWSPVGVKLASASRGKLPRLLAMNWKPYIRPTPTNFGHITKAAVQQAVAEAPAQ